MKTSSIIVMLVTLLISNGSIAQYNAKGKLTMVRTGTDGDAIIVHEDMSVNPASCNGNTVYRLSSANTHFNTHYSILLSAYMAKASIQININENSCEDNYPLITVVRLQE